MVTDGAGLDDKTMFFQHGAKFSVAGALLGVDPDDEHAGGPKEMNEPIQRRPEGLDRVLPPINESHVVLPVRGRPQFAVVATRM